MFDEVAPYVEGELKVEGDEAGDKAAFEGVDGLLCRFGVVFVGCNKLELDLFLTEERFCGDEIFVVASLEDGVRYS